jgi:hypothetical protein
MRKLILAAFAIAAAVLLASFAAPPSGPSQTLPSLDPQQMTSDRPALPVAPATDAH